ncbi:hypothetical protein FKM82_001093 [Ascaphus truei]
MTRVLKCKMFLNNPEPCFENLLNKHMNLKVTNVICTQWEMGKISALSSVRRNASCNCCYFVTNMSCRGNFILSLHRMLI